MTKVNAAVKPSIVAIFPKNMYKSPHGAKG